MSRLAIAAIIALVLMIFGVIVFGGPIIAYLKNRTSAAEAKAEHNADEAAAGSLTIQGTEAIAGAANQAAGAVVTERRATRALENETRRDPAVAIRIPPGELARLRAHDKRLCVAGGIVCGEADATGRNGSATAIAGPSAGAGAVSP